jgi:cardiolipin synthase
VLYVLLGVNRIRRRAIAVHRDRRRFVHSDGHDVAPDRLAAAGGVLSDLAPLARVGARVSGRPLRQGNRIEPLVDGDAAYPAMLAAIEAATASVTLCSYIFDNDRAGRRFVDALGAAVRRGVAVRVLVDGVGAKYSFPPIDRELRRAGVSVARFLPTLTPAAVPFVNLRNHRKVLVIDGRLGFCGGMNIRAGHELRVPSAHPVRDVHFRIEGPIVSQLQDAFAEDWAFTTGEALEGDRFYPALSPASEGGALARVITDGPDDDFDALRAVILAALSSARQAVRVATPYFLPDAAMVAALATTAMRGVEVDLLLPARGNIRLVDWACAAQLWQVLLPGCRVHLSPPPFDHSKLMVVDRAWTLLGSTNWDPRSLRLNFELNVEVYDPALGAAVDDLVLDRIRAARPLTLAEVDGRPLPAKLRDGLARLLSPYL